jgi:hypothetical protein
LLNVNYLSRSATDVFVARAEDRDRQGRARLRVEAGDDAEPMMRVEAGDDAEPMMLVEADARAV